MPEVVVVGAGPAGLATARELAARGINARLLERGDRPGYSWSHLYDSLALHTGKHLSALPGMRFPRATPLFPTRADFLDYLGRYAQRFGIAVEAGTEVTRATPPANGGRWRLDTTAGPIEADAVVFATGIIANPLVPAFPDRDRFTGRVLHSVEYRRPGPFAGRRVLVVGVGNSGGEIASELARAGVDVTIAVRSGANVVPLTLFGIPIQYVSALVRKLPRPAQDAIVAAVGGVTELRRGPPVLPRLAHSPLDAIPLIGFHLVDEIRAGRVHVRPGIERFTESGVRFTDGAEQPFDDVILATGFRPAIDALRDVVRVDARGFALRTGRVNSADCPSLFFVGHNYDATGGLRNIARDAPVAAQHIADTANGFVSRGGRRGRTGTSAPTAASA
jgi:cation diffusion facilitator CzcD-associated flavoprotein CzcO